MPIVDRNKMLHAMQYGVTFTPDELKFATFDLTPQQAIERDLCPETGVPLAEVNIPDHIARLWPKDRSPEAVARIGLLNDWQAKHTKAAD